MLSLQQMKRSLFLAKVLIGIMNYLRAALSFTPLIVNFITFTSEKMQKTYGMYLQKESQVI